MAGLYRIACRLKEGKYRHLTLENNAPRNLMVRRKPRITVRLPDPYAKVRNKKRQIQGPHTLLHYHFMIIHQSYGYKIFINLSLK